MRRERPSQVTSQGGLAEYFVAHRGVGWLAVAAVLCWGVLAYRSLPQQEDPTFPRHDGLVVTVFPGASPQQVEQLVTDRVEAALTEHEAVGEIRSQSRYGVSVVYVLLRSHRQSRIVQSWDEVRAKLRDLVLPEGCLAPRLDTEFQATATLLLSVTSAERGYQELGRVAEQLKTRLQKVPSVGRIRLFGDIPERVELRFSSTTLLQSQLSLEPVIQALAGRNAMVPAGVFRDAEHDLAVQVSGEFQNEQDIGDAVLAQRPDGTVLRVRDVFDLWRGIEDPAPYSAETLHRKDDGSMAVEQSVLLAIEMKQGEVIGEFSRAVSAAVREVPWPPGVAVTTVSDQPAATASRLRQLVRCLVEGILMVLLGCLLLTDWRTALVVAAAIPLTLALTVGGMALLGIPLHQISIAALIIALGLLVDDPVVAADGINRELAAGQQRSVASWRGPYRLRRPILYGTLINIAAFLPLALLPGDMGAFIIALPLVITLALAASRVVSMTFIPLLSYYLLRGQRGLEAGSEQRSCLLLKPLNTTLLALLHLYKGSLHTALRHPTWTLALAYAVLVASAGFIPHFGQQFFPPAERSQCLIDIQLPQGASIRQTHLVCDRIAEVLRLEDSIDSAVLFRGGTAPNFYYNVLPREPAPNVGQVLINTLNAADVPALVVKLRAELDRRITNATCVVRQLDQGPAMEAPIMIRLTGPDLSLLREQADFVARALRDSGGYKVRDDLGRPVSLLQVDIDQGTAGALGLSSATVSRSLLSTLTGFKITDLRESGHLVPVILRMRPTECDELDEINQLPLLGLAGRTPKLGEVAKACVQSDYAAISHSGGRRAVTLIADAGIGDLASRVLKGARKTIDDLKRPPGYRLEYAGEARELEQSRMEMGHVLKISLALIAAVMVIQFQSVAKSIVVMVTVPLGLAGAFAGLAVTGASFGFMALLGLVSLAGVIVSHIIVLSDFIEVARGEGMGLEQALLQAGLVRLRPVLATVLATVFGLVPLALQGGELWRPLTAVHIFGLLWGTVLTLVVLPVWYCLFAGRLRWIT